jgi:putative transposase
MVATRESKELAERLLSDTIAKQNIDRHQVTIHADRGCPMASKTGGVPARRPRRHQVPFASALQQRQPVLRGPVQDPEVPPRLPATFGSVEDARAFCATFYRWYNHDHRHSGIGMHTPFDVHHGRAAPSTRPAPTPWPSPTRPTPNGSSASTPSHRTCPARPGSTDPNQIH